MEDLRKRFENLQIVISSRPESDIGNCPLFRVLRISLLENSDYQSVISRIVGEPHLAGEIIEGVEAHAIKHLLTTPLMVALLVVRYKIEQSIPDTAVSFYENLFPLLLQRHDKTKPGFIRPRKSGIPDSRIELIFNSLAFTAAKTAGVAIPESKIAEIVKRASEIVGETIDSSRYLDDVCKITCLLLHDGGEYRFIHKSVQEFHSALFIKTQPDAVAKEFYASVIASRVDSDGTWHEVLKFLSSIDAYRYLKFCEIPIIRQFLNLPAAWMHGESPKNKDEMIESILKRVSIAVGVDDLNNHLSVLIDDWAVVLCDHEQRGIFRTARQIDWAKVRTKCLAADAPIPKIDSKHWRPLFYGSEKSLWEGLASNWIGQSGEETIRKVGNEFVESLLKRLERNENIVNSIEARKNAVTLGAVWK